MAAQLEARQRGRLGKKIFYYKASRHRFRFTDSRVQKVKSMNQTRAGSFGSDPETSKIFKKSDWSGLNRIELAGDLDPWSPLTMHIYMYEYVSPKLVKNLERRELYDS